MKKRFLFLLACIVLVLSSCQTKVSIDYLYPSDVNMSSYRNLAVMPVVAYRDGWPNVTWMRSGDVYASRLHIRPSYSSALADNVADYATLHLYSVLSSSGYYNLLDTDTTEWIVRSGDRVSERLSDMGYTAVMIPRIEDMTVDERVHATPRSQRVWDNARKEYRTERWYEYEVRQQVSISYSITVVDTLTERVIARRTFVDSAARTEPINPDWPVFDGVEILFRRMINAFDEGIRRCFVPTQRQYEIRLMKNKPKDEGAEVAYEAVDNGYTLDAQNAFLAIWEDRQHIPSGYNAALLIAANGDFDGAIALLEEMIAYTSNADVRDLYNDMLVLRQRNEEAMSQFTVDEDFEEAIEEDSEITIYDYLLR